MRKLLRKLKSCFKQWWNPLIKYRYREMPLPIIMEKKSPLQVSYSATHISAFNYGNKGDLLLPVVLRDLFTGNIGDISWHNAHVYNVVDSYDVVLMNKDDFIVIGGGGLFLKDTNPNDLSGWQWSCDIKHLHKIRKPLIMFAVGYNRFRGQDDFEKIFTEHINAFVHHAAFVGLRNHGSIRAIKKYLKTQELQDKLCFQPCMTTLISKLYPTLLSYNEKKDFIAINCAFDREGLRCPSTQSYESIAKVAKRLSRYTQICLYINMESDKNIIPFMDNEGVNYDVIELNTVQDIIEAYSKPRLVIGMRGHAQMIPFGCHTPILSIISHDKMQWFLDDIHHPEWGVEINDDKFEDKLYEKAVYMYDNYKDVIQNIEKEQDLLWNITMQNMQTIKRIVSKSCKQ